MFNTSADDFKKMAFKILTKRVLMLDKILNDNIGEVLVKNVPAGIKFYIECFLSNRVSMLHSVGNIDLLETCLRVLCPSEKCFTAFVESKPQ